MRKSMQDVRYLLMSHTECIWIQSFEENNVVDDLKELIDSIPKFSMMGMFLWSRTEGLTKLSRCDAEIQDPPNQKIREVPALFSTIRKYQGVDGSVNLWILRDLHTLITDPKTQRYIRDLKEYDNNTEQYYNPIIVIAPKVELPDDVAKLFRVVEYDLPDEEMITSLVTGANNQLKTANDKLEQAFKDPEYFPATDDEVKTLVKACLGLTRGEIVMALKESMVRFHSLNLEFISRNKIETVKKTGVLGYKIPKVSFDDIGGNEVIKQWLNETKVAFSDEAAEFGLIKPKGYVSVGIAGCGKTLMAEAFAHEMHVPLLSLDMSKIMDKLVGQSERKIAYALQVAKACAPCVLLLDEVEKLLVGNSQSDGGVTSRIMAALLQFMNDNDSGVYVIMTSNDISQLPPEFTRAGRLDSIWYFGLPTPEERHGIFKVHFKNAHREVSDIILNAAVKATEGYTGAEIAQVVKVSMYKAFYRYKNGGDKEITSEDVIEAAKEVIPVSQSSREKIAALERYCLTRARSASKKPEQPKKEEAEDDTGFFLEDL